MTSVCTWNTVRGYFLNSTLPANGTVCPTDEVLFPPSSGLREGGWAGLHDDETLALMEKLRSLGRSMEESVGAFKHHRTGQKRTQK